MLKRNTLVKSVSPRGGYATCKETPEVINPKAQLFAQGFEELETRPLPKASPTCATESLRLVLAVLAAKRWKSHSMDTKSAFLQRSELKRDIL